MISGQVISEVAGEVNRLHRITVFISDGIAHFNAIVVHRESVCFANRAAIAADYRGVELQVSAQIVVFYRHDHVKQKVAVAIIALQEHLKMVSKQQYTADAAAVGVITPIRQYIVFVFIAEVIGGAAVHFIFIRKEFIVVRFRITQIAREIIVELAVEVIVNVISQEIDR